MVRLIDADKLIDDIKKRGINKLSKDGDEVELTNFVKGLGEAIKIADAACVIDPVKHGRWVQMGPPNENSETLYRCSICDYLEVVPLYDTNNYCANCGARMDGDDK